jgi:hypothetical protein
MGDDKSKVVDKGKSRLRLCNVTDYFGLRSVSSCPRVLALI